MFQTEIIHAIQSISFEWLTKFLILVDSTGTHQFMLVTSIIIIFGINFKKGIFIAQTVIWTQLLTGILKDYFALPRPYDVDSNIKLFDSNSPNKAPFNNMGARGFFQKLPDEVVNHYRGVKYYPYGFPSGHSSGAMSLWGSTAVAFKKKWINVIGITFIILVPFARLYLGKHFFIDVLGGLFLGILVIIINYLINSNEKPNRIALNRKHVLVNFLDIIFLIMVPISVLLLTKSKFAANLIGLNLGFMLIGFKHFPIDKGTVLNRIARIGIAFIIFIVINYLVSYIYEIFFTKEIRIMRLFKHVFTYFIMIWGSTKILFLMGLFKTSPGQNDHFG